MKQPSSFSESTELAKRIADLPKGYISRKTINGKVYYYHQWSENGQKKSRYLHDDEIETLSRQIEERRSLQTILKNIRQVSKSPVFREDEPILTFCKLMHKRFPVADLLLDQESGFIRRVGTVYAPEHLPTGVPFQNGTADRKALNDWWTDRSIPASRSGIREALDILEISSTRSLLIRSFGLSLSDQYWICPDETELTWDQVNFFDHDFSDDIGNILFGERKKTNALDFSSPDSTSDGSLKKRWKIIDGKRSLIKGGSNPFRQQPFNEVIASGIMERLGIRHVPYSVIWNQDVPYSLCRDFITADTELVSAWRISQIRKKANNTSVYQHLVRCSKELGIPDIVPFLDRMIVLDYLIANEDRHMNNFGAVRNAETLEWLGMAPVYDSGSSLGFDKLIPEIRRSRDILCKPFCSRHEEQLKLVTDFSWIDFDRLSDVRRLIENTFSSGAAREFIDESRACAIADTVEVRISFLKSLAAQSCRL